MLIYDGLYMYVNDLSDYNIPIVNCDLSRHVKNIIGKPKCVYVI